MNAKLPSNPFTISDLRPRANTWTLESVRQKYANRMMDEQAIMDVRRDLEELAAWDNYERKTSDGREAAKEALRKLLGQ